MQKGKWPLEILLGTVLMGLFGCLWFGRVLYIVLECRYETH